MAQMTPVADKLLTNVSSMIVPQGHISELILPEIGSKNSTGKLGKYGTNHLRIEVDSKAGRGSYRRVSPITRTTTSFSIEGHGLEGIVTKEDYANVELPFKAEEDEVLGVTTLLWLAKEKALADTLTDETILTQYTTLTGSDQWSDGLNSDLIADILAGRAAVKDGCGQMPNTVFMDELVADQVRFHPQALDFLGYKFARPGGLSDEELARLFKVDRVLIAKAVYESANQGQTSNLAEVWGKHCVLAVCPEKAMPYQTSLGYMVRYEGEQPRKVYKYPANNPPGANLVLVEDNYDMLISNANAAYLFKNAIA